ncbi:hypothetical protein [Baekduia sp.]|jgi:hypothetical protein|uniref:hypothetical protein n=1 Tax=Baekduia sp. TaxID=2600305 RepID=UPI002DFE7A69|nr:hypothetical protein [Baekduia sp.]
MSTPQRTHAPVMVVVDRETADVLRTEAKKVAMFEHDNFEDLLDFSPDAQHGLFRRYRDVFDLIDAVGCDPEKVDPAQEAFEVPLTEDLINLLGLRRYDLAMSNADRLPEHNGPISPETLAEITHDRLAAQALDRLFDTYNKAARTQR